MAKSAFLSGHGHLFSEDEKALILATDRDNIYRFSWQPLPIARMMMLAVDGPKIVGAITVHRHPTASMYGVVEPMNVHPDYQRQGVGTQLWTAIAAQAKRLGDRGMQVWALDGNAIAVNFYSKRLRLRVVGTGEWWLGDHREPRPDSNWTLVTNND